MEKVRIKTFCDLFCGIGGFHLALASRGLKCVFASDIDKRAREVYADNFGIEPAGDITKIEEKDIPAHDVLCGGFPCQPFSLANSDAKGFEDARGTLFFEIARIAKYHKPKLLLLENVPRILSFDKGRVLKRILETLDDIGYNVQYYKLNAADYGLATARKRIYFVCIRKDLNWISQEPPKADYNDCVMNHVRPDLDTSDLERPVEDYVFRPSKQKVAGKPHRIAAHKDSTPNNGNTGEQGRRLYDPAYPAPAFMAGGRNEFAGTEGYLIPDGPLQIAQHKEKGSMQGYRGYDSSSQAISLTAEGGGAFANTGGYKIEGKIRRLHVEEAKTIQGFPADHRISSGGEGYKQIGNSVIPRMIELIYDSIQGIWPETAFFRLAAISVKI